MKPHLLALLVLANPAFGEEDVPPLKLELPLKVDPPEGLTAPPGLKPEEAPLKLELTAPDGALTFVGYFMGNMEIEIPEIKGEPLYVEYTCTGDGKLLDFFATVREGNTFWKWQGIHQEGKVIATKKKWGVKGLTEVDVNGSGVLHSVEILTAELAKLDDKEAKIEGPLRQFLQAIRKDYDSKNQEKKKPEEEKKK